MQAFWLPFVILPSIGGTLAGSVAVDWRLAAALTAGALALLVLPSGIFGPITTVARPLASGVTIGALAVMPTLFGENRPPIWTRMSIGLCAAFLAHLVYLSMIGPI